MAKKPKTDPNHKASFQYGVTCTCSCGWRSGTWYGKGAQSNAAGEWRWHKEQCRPVEQSDA